MMLPVNLFFWSICIVPIVLLLILMVFFHWGASQAAPFTLAVASIFSLLFFKADLSLLIVELLKASWNSLGIILVIVTAILLYEIGIEANAFDALNDLFTKLAPNELIRILMIGVVFASFLQGITGFGVPVLIVAPMLLNMGVAPLYAVMIPLLGHSWAGTFGTLALGWDALLIQTGIVDKQLIMQIAIYASLFLFVLTFLFSAFIVYLYGRQPALKKGFPALLIISLIQGSGQLFLSTSTPALAVVIPSVVSLFAIIGLSKTPMYRQSWKISNSKIMLSVKEEVLEKTEDEMTAVQALSPYLLVTSISLLVLLVPFIHSILGGFKFGPSFKETQTGFGIINPAIEEYAPIAPFTHVSAFLLISFFITYMYYCKKGLIKNRCFPQLLKRAVRKTLSPGIAIFSLLCLSRVMAGTGQTFVLAQGIASVLKEKYVFVSPFIGLLGSFITGSNMTSNILFGEFQLHVSEYIGLKTSVILGAQTGGGGIGTSIAPGNIILGTTTAGILGSEGRVLIKLIPYTLIAAVIFGILVYLDYQWI